GLAAATRKQGFVKDSLRRQLFHLVQQFRQAIIELVIVNDCIVERVPQREKSIPVVRIVCGTHLRQRFPRRLESHLVLGGRLESRGAFLHVRQGLVCLCGSGGCLRSQKVR